MISHKGITMAFIDVYVNGSNVAHNNGNDVILLRATWTEKHYSLQITVSPSNM